MKGVVYLGESRVEVREFPRPKPGPGMVVIEMKAAGLCGSDLHKYHNTQKWAEGREGMISGHEPTGIVAETGTYVKNVAVGDRVCVYHSIGCGHCPVCLAGTPVFCDHEGAFGRTLDGCHADYMATEAKYCLPLPDEFSFAVGAQLACTAGTAFAALKKIPSRAGETVVIFGLGPVGLAAMLMSDALEYRTIAVDINPYRVALAKRVGKGTVINGNETDAGDAVGELTQGTGAKGVIECSGSAAARSQAAAVAGLHGTVVYVGAGADTLCVDFLDILRKELTFRGNSVYSIQEYFELVDFVRNHRVPLDELVTHRFGIEQAPEAFSLFNSGETGKTVFIWD